MTPNADEQLDFDFMEIIDTGPLSTYEMVREFHTAMGQLMDTSIDVSLDANRTLGQNSIYNLRIDLIREEYYEFLDADTPENMLKELMDLKYVIDGFCATFGWDADIAFRRVHESNMSKLGDDGKPVYREDGKVMKGPNHKPCDLGDLV